MARWRLSGTNWEGRPWVASTPIIAIANQLSVAFPSGHGADGTVASKAHDKASPNSDHRPKPLIGPGTVRAIDVGINSPAERAIPETLRQKRDPRVRYAILDGRIFDDDTWTWRPYTGINPHTTHFHLSVNASADIDGKAWDLGLEQQGGDEDMALTADDLNKIADAVWFRLVTHPVTGEKRGAQALLADAVKYAADAAAKPAGSGGATADQVADKLAQRLQA